ncbi:helix-turn-helix transcriptional regulator [Streptomyces mirabilis]|uniref:helix-turn-helix domain-containing protein n=1 Tax=Streptomyces mirabilis TaxID=68239 RepID=UPI0033C031F1
MTEAKKSLIERYADFPRGAQELSAARLAQSVSAALQRAMAASGKTARDLARLLGVTEGAVSQVLNGDGNVRISTLGRYLRAMGYEARIELHPVDSTSPPIEPRRRRARRVPDKSGPEVDSSPREERVSVSLSHLNVTDGNVVTRALLLVLAHDSQTESDDQKEAVRDSQREWHILDAITSVREESRWQTSSVATVGRTESPEKAEAQ